jgi:exosome complex component RRP40
MDGDDAAPFKECVVLPGDDVTPLLAAVLTAPSLRAGQGLLQGADGRVRACRAGVLARLPPDRFFVLSSPRRFLPAVGDTVVGIVQEKLAEHYRVRLHGTALAHLPLLAFDGATKRNKPDLAPGALVFARVVACSKHMAPELTCAALPGAGPKKDWVTGQGVFGELRGGRLVHASLGLARRLLDPRCALLAALARAFPFELAVGVNGLVWAAAAEDALADAVADAVQAAEGLDEAGCEAAARAAVGRAAAAGEGVSKRAKGGS